MPWFVGLLLKPFGKWIALGAIAAAAIIPATATWWATSSFYELRITRDAKDKAEARVARLIGNAEFLGGLVKASDENVGRLVAAQNTINAQTHNLLSEVRRHVTPDVDRRYPLPWSLVRAHDAAVFGGYAGLAAGSYGPDASPATVAASDFADRITENYGACRKAYEWGEALKRDDELVRQMYNDYAARVAGKGK